MKLLEENIRETLQDTVPKSQDTTAKVDKWDYMN
jgi:hypothetical protein